MCCPGFNVVPAPYGTWYSCSWRGKFFVTISRLLGNIYEYSSTAWVIQRQIVTPSPTSTLFTAKYLEFFTVLHSSFSRQFVYLCLYGDHQWIPQLKCQIFGRNSRSPFPMHFPTLPHTNCPSGMAFSGKISKFLPISRVEIRGNRWGNVSLASWNFCYELRHFLRTKHTPHTLIFCINPNPLLPIELMSFHGAI